MKNNMRGVKRNMKNMKIDANGTEIRVMGDVVMKMLTFHLLILQNIKIQIMPSSLWQTGCVIILRFHFWACGNKFTIPILNLSNSIGLKQNLEIMLLH